MADEALDGIAWVKTVQDPRRFGVAEEGESKIIKRLIEKPESMENNLALVGCYYFRSGEELVSAIQEQFKRDLQLKGEYFLVDAINIMIEKGSQMRTQTVDTWLDTGTIEATLETNRHLLKSRRALLEVQTTPDVEIIAPVFIHPDAKVKSSRIGPNVSIGANCQISDCKIEDSILEQGVKVENAHLRHSFLGRTVTVRGGGKDGPAAILNLGDDSSVEM